MTKQRSRCRHCCRRRVGWLLLLLCNLISVGVCQPRCSVCEDGSEIPSEKHNQSIHLENFRAQTCRELVRTARHYPSNNSVCDLIQTLGPLCGCSIHSTTENGCGLCRDDGADLTNTSSHILSEVSASYLLPDIPFASELSPVTCGVLQSVLYTSDHPDAPHCQHYQSTYGSVCGCPDFNRTPGTTNTTNIFANKGERLDPNHWMTQKPTTTDSPCTLCADESHVLHPDLETPESSFELPTTCAAVEALAPYIPESDSWCREARSLGAFCGCQTPHARACSLCPNGESVPRPNRKLNWIDQWSWLDGLPFQGGEVTCLEVEAFGASYRENPLLPPEEQLLPNFDAICMAAQLRSWICGCSPDWRQITLTWSYRISGILSFLGSLSIIFNVLRKKEMSRKTTYHQIIMSICVFDCVSSFFYTLAGIMTPLEDGFYLSRGNYDTCKMQAFMIQLGHQTSMFYNMCLSLYFLLMISYNWNEYQFQKYMPYIHGTVIILGLSLALGALPFYGPQLCICDILQPPARTVTWWPVTMFFIVPLSIVLLTLACSTATICHHVYQQQQRAAKWSLQQSNATSNLSRRVFWQSFWYVMAFYFTFPFLLLSYYFRFRGPQFFWVLIVSAVLGPSQGFVNTFVYFHRLTANQPSARPSLSTQYSRLYFRTSSVMPRWKWIVSSGTSEQQDMNDTTVRTSPDNGNSDDFRETVPRPRGLAIDHGDWNGEFPSALLPQHDPLQQPDEQTNVPNKEVETADETEGNRAGRKRRQSSIVSLVSRLAPGRRRSSLQLAELIVNDDLCSGAEGSSGLVVDHWFLNLSKNNEHVCGDEDEDNLNTRGSRTNIFVGESF